MNQPTTTPELSPDEAAIVARFGLDVPDPDEKAES